MLIKLVEQNTEAEFLKELEELNLSPLNRPILLCKLSQTSVKPEPGETLLLLKEVIENLDGQLYFCADGDLVIIWRGKYKEVMNEIIMLLTAKYRRLRNENLEEVFKLYDSKVGGEELLLIFRDKLNNVKKGIPFSILPHSARFSSKQIEDLAKAITERKADKLRVLIVEDQGFSQKLLMSMLEKDYSCYGVKSGQEAINIYAELAPNITFLDIELPDMSGHELAALFRKHDPDSFIIMVTANNYIEDVKIAKTNNVQGFIAKPYNKQKIMSVFEIYNVKFSNDASS